MKLFIIVALLVIMMTMMMVTNKTKKNFLWTNREYLTRPADRWFSLGDGKDIIISSDNHSFFGVSSSVDGTGLDPDWPMGWTYDWNGGHARDRDMILEAEKRHTYGPPKRTMLH
jgi:hypothetical protein